MASDAFENLRTALSATRVTPDGELEAARLGYDAVGSMIPLVDGTTVEPVDAGGAAAEWVRAPGLEPGRAIVWFHGGGYVIGSPASHRPFASRLSAATAAPVLVVDYARAPEHPYPAALDDAMAAYRWVLADGLDAGHVALGGDSAGGGLALATAIALRDAGDPQPAAIALSSPWLDLTLAGDSMAANRDDDIILSAELLDHWAGLYAGDTPRTDPGLSPLFAPLDDLPPLLVHVARTELLFDDTVRLEAAARAVDREITVDVDDEMIHHWHVFAGLFPEGDDAVDRLGAWLASRLG
jgi:acetyl esterase/lipase